MLVVLAALASAPPAIAADNTTQAETVVVTARLPDPVGNDAFSTVQLDASELLTYQQLDKSLGQVPGLSLFRRDSSISANPTTQGVSLRASRHRVPAVRWSRSTACHRTIPLAAG